MPTALRDDIQVEHFMKVGPECVRIARDPLSGNLHYMTFGGDVFEITLSETGKPSSHQIADSTDHGITRLQGMVFQDSTLFLVGNIRVNEGKGTQGRLMRGTLDAGGKRVWSTLLMTEEIGSTRTLYDHGFNGITVRGQYLYLNSGARTDHGEVQDNDGEYPGSRDEPLTAAIFRIPTNAHDLTLPNDSVALAAGGYLFADGIRNCYDMAFAPNGHLFCVSNSADYDHPEDMFWLRQGHHYGFPWVMGNLDNPQQFPGFDPDPDKDPFINPRSHASRTHYFHNDPTFPKRPQRITPPVANIGPDANYFRDPETGAVMKGDEVGVAVGTFTPHRSPLGLFFDTDSLLAQDFRGDGFVLGWTDGKHSSLMKPFSPYGADMMHLRLSYDPDVDNYIVQTTRIVEGFHSPVDAEMVGPVVYVIEYGGQSGNIWKLTFPTGESRSRGF